jgi:hypothetical protein
VVPFVHREYKSVHSLPRRRKEKGQREVSLGLDVGQKLLRDRAGPSGKTAMDFDARSDRL